MSVAIDGAQVGEMLTSLTGKDATAQLADSVEPHPAATRGLVTNENQLVAVIGADLDFAHKSGAALAMIPSGRCEDAGDEPDDDLILGYREVSNVLSRLVDEATPMRVRIDPGMDHEYGLLQAVVATGTVMTICEVDIDGYGPGRFGVWFQA